MYCVICYIIPILSDSYYLQIYWSTLYYTTDLFFQKSFLKNLNKKLNFFINVLKKNELFFIEEEYVIFYELDITKIHGLNNNIHNTKKYVKYLTLYWTFLYKNVNYFLNSNKTDFLYKYPYLFHFINKYNKTLKIKKNFWKNVENYKIVTLHHKKKKLNITVKNYKRILITLSSGISIKKLGIEEKKNKKSFKVFSIMIKSIFKNLKPSNNFFKCILQFKGSSFYIMKYIDVIIQLNFKYKEMYCMFTPNITFNYKFKKIRSLKKNFRKNFLKIN